MKGSGITAIQEKARRLGALIPWIWQAQTIDTIDSPHISEFIRDVIWKNEIPLQTIHEIENRRKELLRSTDLILAVDLGAGSSVTSNQRRTISEIAKNAVSSKDKCRLLYNIVQYFNSSNILELGTSLGISSLYLSKAASQGTIYTIEGDLNILGHASSHQIPNTEHLKYINADFEQGMNQLLSEGHKMDLILIDGAHSSILQKNLLPYYKSLSGNTCVWIVDDIYWSSDMTDWWNMLKKEDRFNIAIDLFHFGILYFNESIKEPINLKLLPKKIRWKLGLTRHQD